MTLIKFKPLFDYYIYLGVTKVEIEIRIKRISAIV